MWASQCFWLHFCSSCDNKAQEKATKQTRYVLKAHHLNIWLKKMQIIHQNLNKCNSTYNIFKSEIDKKQKQKKQKKPLDTLIKVGAGVLQCHLEMPTMGQRTESLYYYYFDFMQLYSCNLVNDR